MSKRKLLLYLLSFSAVVMVSFFSLQRNEAKPFHSRLETEYLGKLYGHQPQMGPVIDSNEFFLGSIRCQGCHGFDSLHHANVDANGVDINLYDDWESTMMANSARDPLWRAKVSHEILVNAGHSLELQTTCTSCHAPMGHYTAIYHGATYYTLDSLYADTLGLNGVACGGCHEIGTQQLGTLFSGNIPYDTTKKEFGPFTDPFTGPMELYVGLTPTYSDHMSTSFLCSPCHTLITKTVDLDGNYNGNTFVEQATFHEWENSIYSQDNGQVCQHCHMPQVTDSVVIANNILALAPRSPFNQHQFVGANYFIVNMIKQNKAVLGATAEDVDFDSTLAATTRMLTQNALSVKLFIDSLSTDTAYVRFLITNKAGHKFPSGYPSRRAVVQLIVTNSTGDTAFATGVFDSTDEVKNIDPAFEPHYNVITTQQQVQIYEMIMGDVNGDVTTVLERADAPLKDNRIPPEGFVTYSPVYDTTRIVGNATTDPDFNKINNTEGAGSDAVHYHIALSGLTGPLNVFAKVLYQSVPPRWVADMFTHSSPEIQSFKDMFEAADNRPIVAAHDSLLNIALPTGETNVAIGKGLQLLWSPAGSTALLENSNTLMVYSAGIFDAEGRPWSQTVFNSNGPSLRLNMPANGGIYLVEVKTNQGNFVFKIVKTF